MLHYYFQGYADAIVLATTFNVRHTRLGTRTCLPGRAPNDVSGEVGRDRVAACDAEPRGRTHRRVSDAERFQG